MGLITGSDRIVRQCIAVIAGNCHYPVCHCILSESRKLKFSSLPMGSTVQNRLLSFSIVITRLIQLIDLMAADDNFHFFLYVA